MSLSAISKYLASIGCEFPDIDLLQPADPFLNTTGEDLRRRIFITQENSGTLHCLRPEFTIPVGLYHLGRKNASACYAYGGKVFRQRRDGAMEFTQAGFEDIGNSDKSAADINAISTALGVLGACQISDAELVIGDQSIFTTLLDSLEIPAAWRKKLVRSFGDDALLRTHIAEMAEGGSAATNLFPKEITEGLAQGDTDQLTAAVTGMMLADGLPLVGGRTPSAIVERIQEKAELGSIRLEVDKRKILEKFLDLDVNLQNAGQELEGFAKASGLQLPGSVEALENLTRGLTELNGQARYKASFGRRLDYYTGLVFEIYPAKSRKPVIGGGRYDQLMTLLGATKEIPAVGFAIWVDRLGGIA